ncbi:MAG: erythromycin esterase family protein [Verrucomicrobiae bacterium]|nr:erythromycin esterase family protein [Verrucomicrobiae bacterium]
MKKLIALIQEKAQPLTGSSQDYDALLDLVGDASFVLLGEASHGTHEFYRERAKITRRLIQEKGFQAVAVEADWPDAYRVNRFVHGTNSNEESIEALGDFKRFPLWMWRNAEVLDFTGWLRDYNETIAKPAKKVSFLGMDLYSLHTSIGAVLNYLAKVDPLAAQRARLRYSCFDHFGSDVQGYGWATGLGISKSCEEEVIKALLDLSQHQARYLSRDGYVAMSEYFSAEQNARLIKNAEHYYRAMFQAEVSSWNLRDTHMVETLEALRVHLKDLKLNPKIVIWAHNSHLGNAGATEMGQRGEINVGHLLRKNYGNQAMLVGLTTYQGTVTAASEWDAPAERKQVRPALLESFEALFHESGISRFFLNLKSNRELEVAFAEPRLERAIGVIYRPETERLSHYFRASLSEQFDAILHFDYTRAVEPLERTTEWEAGEEDAPETYPSGM